MAADNAAATRRAARRASALSCLRAPARASRTSRPANGSHRSRCSSGIAAAGPLPAHHRSAPPAVVVAAAALPSAS